MFGFKKDSSEITSIFDSGFQQGKKVPRTNMDTKKVEWFDTNACILLSGIDLGRLPETVVSRCIEIRLDRATGAETCQIIPFRPKLHEKEAKELGVRLEKWAESVRQLVKENSAPVAPAGIFGRNEDRWESLFIVADVADFVTCVTPVTDAPGKAATWGELIRAAAVDELQERTKERDST
jgi:Protein of unknown function (DUF3631)